MRIEDIEKDLNQKLEKLKKNGSNSIINNVTAVALKFIDDNFRQAGWEGNAWKRADGTPTNLVQTGLLRAGFRFEISPGQVRIYNLRPYAQVHNEGFEGPVKVKAHTRATYRSSKTKKYKKKKNTRIEVKAHTRMVKIPQNQFLPTEKSPSQTLDTTIRETIQNEVNKILNP